jgi:flagellar biosynthetic protein FliR
MFEALGFTLTQLELWLLIFVRFFTILAVMPFFSYDSFDMRLRAILSIVLATIMVKLIPYPKSDFPVEFIMLMFYVAREVLIGLCIGMFSAFFVEIVKFGGNQVSHMMGLNMASMIDPTTNEDSEVMPELFNIVALLLILAISGHHFFIKAMFDTLFYIPITKVNFNTNLTAQMISLASNVILMGIRIAAPMVILIFLVRIIVGILNRLVQEADVFSVIMIVNVFIGIYILVFYWTYFAQMTNLIFNLTQRQLMAVISLMRSSM